MTTNTLTNLIPNLYADLDVVSRELTGLIPAVTLDASLARGRVGQSIFVPAAPTNTSSTIVPNMIVPAEADQVIGSSSFNISKSKAVSFSWDGEEEKGLNTGPSVSSVWRGQFAQAVRVLVNEIEADLAALQTTFSRAHGAATTTPFGTAGNYTDASNVLRILKDNGAPLSDNHLVMNTAAGANFLGMQADSNRQGTDSILRQGVLLDTTGMALRESAQINTFTAGSFSAGTLTSAVRAVGSTVLVATADYTAGLGLGDVITLAHESGTRQYVVQAVAAGSITIQAPGLRTATAATGTVAITKVATSARNMAFNRSAILLATRLPERPSAGDLAIDVTTITDPRSGLSFEVAVYPGYRKVLYEVAIAWGVANIKPAHTALLLG